MFVRHCSPCPPMPLRCLMLMLSGTVCSILYGPHGGHFDITVQAISI